MLACPPCDATFKRQSSANRHFISKHSVSAKQLKCLQCHKIFSRRNVLERHMRIHAGASTETCPICFKNFSRRDYVKRHQDTCQLKVNPDAQNTWWITDSSSTPSSPTLPSTPTSAMSQSPQTTLQPNMLPIQHEYSGGNTVEELISFDRGTQQFQIAEMVQSEATFVPAEDGFFKSDALDSLQFPLSNAQQFLPAALQYDELGRTNIEYWPTHNDVVPLLPPFLAEVIESLQAEFPPGMIHAFMRPQQVGIVSRHTFTENLVPGQVAARGFKLQYVPMIRCWYCYQNFFELRQHTVLQEVRSHSRKGTHTRNARLRTIAASDIVQVALSCIVATDTERLRNGLAEIWFCKQAISQLDRQYTSRTGWSLLILACEKGSFDIVKLLLAEGYDARHTDYAGWTTMHHACGKGELEVGKSLLPEYGRLLDTVDREGRTPIDLAVNHGYLHTVVELIEFEASLKGKTALSVACFRGHPEIVEELLRAGADVNKGATLPPIETALSLAPCRTIELLLRAGAKTDRISSATLDGLKGRGMDPIPGPTTGSASLRRKWRCWSDMVWTWISKEACLRKRQRPGN